MNKEKIKDTTVETRHDIHIGDKFAITIKEDSKGFKVWINGKKWCEE